MCFVNRPSMPCWGLHPRSHTAAAALPLQVSANSFFQTNTRQAEVLYRLVAQAAGTGPPGEGQWAGGRGCRRSALPLASFDRTSCSPATACPPGPSSSAELRPSDVVLDLFCGTGTIGLTLARACRSVRGVELSAAAVADARRNAARNGILNAEFVEVSNLTDVGRW